MDKPKSTTAKNELMKDWDCTLNEYNIIKKLLDNCSNEDYDRLKIRYNELDAKINDIIKKVKECQKC